MYGSIECDILHGHTINNTYYILTIYYKSTKTRSNLPILYIDVQDKGKRVTKTFDIHYTYNIV